MRLSAIRRMRTAAREWPKHRDYVRSHKCLTPGCENRDIEFAHVRTGTDGGAGLKPSDWWGVPLCHACHARQHQIGEAAYEREAGVSMRVAAERLTMSSTDIKMRRAWNA